MRRQITTTNVTTTPIAAPSPADNFLLAWEDCVEAGVLEALVLGVLEADDEGRVDPLMKNRGDSAISLRPS